MLGDESVAMTTPGRVVQVRLEMPSMGLALSLISLSLMAASHSGFW